MKQSAVTIHPVQDDKQKDWNTLVKHPLQSLAWGEFRKKMGIDVVRLGVFSGDILTEAYQITFHPLPNFPYLPHLPYTIGYLPKSSVPTEQTLDELAKIGKQKNAIFIQLEPNILSNNVTIQQCNNLRKSHHPLFTRYTFVLDLSQSEEELLESMHSKTRYNMRLAQKHGVVIKEDNSKEAFEEYIRLSKETTERQGFFAHNERYHRTMWKTLHPPAGGSDQGKSIAHLWTASYQGKTLAAWIVFVWNDTIYYPYGASSREHRDVMAPNLLLWEIVRWAKKQGFKHFDLWGALGPPPAGGPDIKDPWYGFHRFKEGYKPNLIEFVGSYDLVMNPFLYSIYCKADTVRWFLLKLKARFSR